MKYNLEIVRNIFKNENCELLEDGYINNKTPLNYRCSCGNKSKISLSSFLNGNRCFECGRLKKKKPKLTIEEVKSIFGEGNCILLSTQYFGIDSNLEYVCNCGNKATTTLKRFKLGNRCRDCGYKKLSDKQFLSVDEITKRLTNKGLLYLNHEYTDKGTIVTYECDCGRSSTTSLSNIPYTEKCRACSLEQENNPNWKGGISSSSNLIRTSDEYQSWRISVLKRDNYTCQKCSKTGDMRVHHIESFAKNEAKRLDMNNAITLCASCHDVKIPGSFHNTYGTVNFTKDDFLEFMNSY